MKIISWNVNWIRAILKKGFIEFFNKEKADIFCLQETKAFEEQFIKEVGTIPGYKWIWHAGKKPGYAWTAIIYKEDLPVLDRNNTFWEIEHFHTDGRITEIEFEYKWEKIVLINWYFPNGWTRADGTEMLTYKLEFYDKLIDYTRKIKQQWKHIIITWDFNICHTEIDIARPKENQNSIWFLPIEREKIWELINDWNVDVWRHFYPNKKDVYSWWSYRAWARQRNVWWRIDYFVVNKELLPYIKNIEYLTDVMGSDHCPVKLELK